MNIKNNKAPMSNKLLKTATLLCLLAIHCMTVRAQYVTEFLLTDLDNAELKSKVQQNISRLLTEFNLASAAGRDVNFDSITIGMPAQMCIQMIWKNTPFRTGDTEVIERCLNTYGGDYEVRNIPLFLKGGDTEQYQEAVIGFDRQGNIIDFHLTIDNNLYVKVLKKGWDVTDLRYRQIILDYVEQFRTAYNTKDMDFLEQIYSDDALIITGKVIKSVPSEMNNFMPEDKVIYNKQNKRQYLNNLARVFRSNKRINVMFDDIKVIRHPAKENYYGVTLKQGYTSDYYSDSGYLFLLWDFNKPDAPQIHVRTWQPEMINETTRLPEEEIFTCEDFDIM